MGARPPGAPVSAPSLFCDHKRLRTTCPECKPPAPAAPLPRTPARAPKKEAEGGDDKAKKSGNMLPLKRRQRTPASRAEADQAEAWWVKRR